MELDCSPTKDLDRLLQQWRNELKSTYLLRDPTLGELNPPLMHRLKIPIHPTDLIDASSGIQGRSPVYRLGPVVSELVYGDTMSIPVFYAYLEHRKDPEKPLPPVLVEHYRARRG
jgi:hypothetical protein